MILNILLFTALFLGSLALMFFLFNKLTADNIPRNLRRHTYKNMTIAVISLIVLFGGIALLMTVWGTW